MIDKAPNLTIWLIKDCKIGDEHFDRSNRDSFYSLVDVCSFIHSLFCSTPHKITSERDSEVGSRLIMFKVTAKDSPKHIDGSELGYVIVEPIYLWNETIHL